MQIILKQLDYAYNNILFEENKELFKKKIIENLEKASKDCYSKINLDQNKRDEYKYFEDRGWNAEEEKIEIEKMKEFWKDSEISEKYSKLFCNQNPSVDMLFPEEIECILSRIEDIERGEVVVEDLLRSFITTNGVGDTEINSKDGKLIRVVDIGGRRSERKSWVHFFKNVSLIIFTVDLTNFFKVLMEDEHINAMNEDLKL
eukprot:TRINITY_DN13097_c0_g1_i1.p1 TRINITY_DN13097_c0_g1~~TRINITY_DN13097_c0_g1_i1.p1  ORF type:complete len:202 (-),score=51.16 TRINITY_DN13097_c0_g1_i1:45-650(-)